MLLLVLLVLLLLLLLHLPQPQSAAQPRRLVTRPALPHSRVEHWEHGQLSGWGLGFG